MTKKELDRAFSRDIVILFETQGEFTNFLKAIKSFGGKWLNGDEIKYCENDLNSKKQFKSWLAVSRDYKIGYVSGMCYHYGAYPTIKYSKFTTDKCIIDIEDIKKNS